MQHSRTSYSRIALSILATCFLTTWLACSRSVVEDKLSPEARNYRPPVNAPAPLSPAVDGFNIKMLNGGNVRVSDLVGKNKVVLVNFWATWCGPCRREIPDLAELKKKFDPKDVEIIGLTVEEPELQDTVRAFAQQFSINYTIGFAPRDLFFTFNQSNGNDPRAPIPQTFIFGRNGKLVDSVKGLRRDFKSWAEGAIGHALKSS